VVDAALTASLNDRAKALRPGKAVALFRAAAPFLACVLLAVVLQLGVKPLLNDFIAKMALDIATNVILAVSLTMVNGFTGQFSIGHAAFMAVGAYTAAAIVYYGSFRIYGNANVHGGLLSTMLGADRRADSTPLFTGADGLFLLSLLAGGLVAAAAGYVVGLPSLRLRGDYLAIVTLGFGEIVRVLIQSQTVDTLWDAKEIAAASPLVLAKHLGGALGFSGLPFYNSLFWGWLFAALTLVVAFRLKFSTYGRAFLSIREDEIAAEAMGIHTTRYKVRAFVIAAFFAGIAGGLFAHTVGVQLNPGELAFQKSFDIIIMVVLGGLGSITGAAIAATILTILPELLRQPPSIWPWGLVILIPAAIIISVAARRKVRALLILATVAAGWEIVRQAALRSGVNLSDYRMVLYALALIIMMIVRPKGLFGVREIWELRRSRPLPPPGPPPAASPLASALKPVEGRRPGGPTP